MRFDESKVSYELECQPEYESPEGFFASGDDELDKQDCDWIRAELESGNEWAWCTAKVTATYEGLPHVTGVSYLGACSYPSESDFRQPGGYFDDMKAEALADLRAQLESIAAIVCG